MQPITEEVSNLIEDAGLRLHEVSIALFNIAGLEPSTPMQHFASELRGDLQAVMRKLTRLRFIEMEHK